MFPHAFHRLIMALRPKNWKLISTAAVRWTEWPYNATDFRAIPRGTTWLMHIKVIYYDDSYLVRFAYIEFGDKESVQTALALDDSLFRGRQIKVKFMYVMYNVLLKVSFVYFMRHYLHIM